MVEGMAGVGKAGRQLQPPGPAPRQRAGGDTARVAPPVCPVPVGAAYCAGLIVLIQSGEVRCQKQELMYGLFSSG